MPSALLANVCIVLSRPSHPGNIGAAARAMKTMGLAHLRLVVPARFPDAEATALASGAVDVLDGARVFDSLEGALADRVVSVGFTARPRDLSHPARSLRDVVPEVLAGAAHAPVALVFGNETFGLSNEELARCTALAHIPANPAYSSLNLAAAVQVACYELSVAAEGFAIPAEPARNAATGAEVEALFEHWERAMVESGFLDPAQPKRLMERLRRLFARGGLEREEVQFLRGMLASFQKRKPGT
jgi:tRNA/rRNA methyltransferase